MNRVKNWIKVTALLVLAAPAITACQEFESYMKPKPVLLAEIERDLYKAILASDKIDKLREKPKTKAQNKSPGSKSTKTVSKTQKAELNKNSSKTQTSKPDAPKEKEKSDSIVYLSQAEITPVNMKFQGNAESFFGKIAKDLKYKIVSSGKPRDIELNIDAENEPMIGVAIRAANYVEQDMKVRLNMEEKIIRIEYLD